ncbi:MFS transporter, partial [Acinetobacter baumannii]
IPFMLYSANAARMADSIERKVLLRGLKYFELVTALVAVAALLIGNLTSGLIALVAFGAQAAVSSPVKYALLPQYLGPGELVAGNGLFEG